MAGDGAPCARPAGHDDQQLARRLSYAPSTVSAHLDVLARAGLVDRHRVRRCVSTASGETGTSLVAL
jgi:DNA-binding MarR family transcriptional regulator